MACQMEKESKTRKGLFLVHTILRMNRKLLLFSNEIITTHKIRIKEM